MSGTKAGGKAAAATNKAKYGADFYEIIGKQGGRNGRGHTFAHGKVDPSIAGAKGGRKSRKGKKNTQSLFFQILERMFSR